MLGEVGMVGLSSGLRSRRAGAGVPPKGRSRVADPPKGMSRRIESAWDGRDCPDAPVKADGPSANPRAARSIRRPCIVAPEVFAREGGIDPIRIVNVGQVTDAHKPHRRCLNVSNGPCNPQFPARGGSGARITRRACDARHQIDLFRRHPGSDQIGYEADTSARREAKWECRERRTG